jgi:1,4-dihydroxy-2-naphthoate octaprenyltransferase
MNSELKAWYRASRPPFFITTLVPLTLGLVLAARERGEWPLGLFLLILFGAFVVYLAANIGNDYFDHLLGADSGDAIGGSRVLQRGLLSPAALRNSLVFLYSLGFVSAVLLTLFSGQYGLWLLILFAGASSLFYVAPPIKYGYRGLGELFVFINMGPIMVCGTYWVLAEHWNWATLWYAMPIGLMVANILYFQNLPDMKTDEAAGKRTLAVRLGQKGSHMAFRFFWAVTYGFIIGLSLAGYLSFFALLSLLTLPLFIKADRHISETAEWVELDKHGHLVRKLYLSNGLIVILAAVMK